MKQNNRQKSIVRLAIALIVVNAFIGLTTNIATGILPESIKPFIWLSWPFLGLLLILYIFLTRKIENSSQKAIKPESKNSSILWKNTNIQCPYCLEYFSPPSSSITCPNCEAKIPISYVDNYKTSPTYFLSTIGWAGGGKSSFFVALTTSVERLVMVWPDYYYRVNYISSEWNEARDLSNFRAWPDSIASAIGSSAAHLIEFRNMPRWGKANLIIRDFYGEILTADTNVRSNYLLNSNVVLLFTSIVDAQKFNTPSIDSLLTKYISFINKYDNPQENKKRNLIVVLTKSDLINNLPESLSKYAISGVLPETDMTSYTLKMGRISREIETWLKEDNNGKAFIRLAEHARINVKYTLVSALAGYMPDLKNAPSPARVLDPLFWAFEMCNNEIN